MRRFFQKATGVLGNAPHNAVLICEANMFFFCGYSVKKEQRGFAQRNPKRMRAITDRPYLLRKN
ncbi:MAG: hypothetical protein J6R46_00385, partial [Clostridia bacterium]|nr:hypothetical protein [Clostridia bacterium]